MYKFRLFLSLCFTLSLQLLLAQINIDLPSSYTVCEGESVLLSPVVSGGDGNYTYSWSPAIGLSDPTIANPTAAPLTETTYTLLVTDGASEQESATTTISVSALLDINASIINVTCSGTSDGGIDLNVTGGTPGYVYQWSIGATTEDITGLAAGTYSVTVFDANGCSVVESFTITEPSPIMVSAEITDADCGQANGSITLNVTGGVPPYEYIWDNGAITQILPDLAIGIYTVTVVDANGCTATNSFVITNDSGLIVDVGPDAIICEGESISINAQVGGGVPGYTYSWNTGETTQVITVAPLTTTNYIVTVTDSNGCETIDAVTIIVSPIPVITGDVINEDCSGAGTGSIFLNVNGGGAAFVWSNGTTTQNITNLTAGTYCVTVVNFDGCEAVNCFEIEAPPFMQVDIIGGPTQDCDTDYTLQASVTGGTAPYVYQWTGPESFSSTVFQLDGSGLISGIYTLTVIDANGCQATQSIEIDTDLQISLSALPLNCGTGLTTINTTGTSTGPDYIYEWTGPNSFTSNQLDITVGDPGQYTLSVTNTVIEDCSSSETIEVVAADFDLGDGIQVDIFDCNVYRLSAILPSNYFGPINLLWIFPDGTTNTLNAISPTISGVYTLTTSFPELDCEYHSSYFLDLEGIACSVLEGYVRFDESEDCVADDNEIGLQNIIVTATASGATFTAITDATGYYRFNLPSDTYTVSTTLPTPSWIACQEEYTVDVSMAGVVETLNIPLQGEGVCPELSVSLSSNLLRRCFTSNYFLTVCNEGTEAAVLPEVALLLDDYLNFSGASPSPNSINGQQLNWTIDEIGVGECVTIIVWMIVDCEAELGQTHCSEAHASSYPFCGSADGWSGANLELMASCDGEDVLFNIRNTGTGDLNETVNYIIIEDGVAMMDAAGIIDNLAVSDETEFSFPANGSTYTFMLDQAPNHPYTLSVTNSIEGCGTNTSGGFSTGFVNQFSQQTATESSTIFCLENVGSWDPNDKAAIPVGYGDAHYIEPEDKINYHIRFQNTGSDTAFTVVVRDTLSDLLDIRTLEPGNSSHDYNMEIFGEKVLSFTFNNILLVDSFTNEPASNGFVDFSISPKIDAPLESVVENKAAIFFDFNEPVITNIVFHTLGRDFYDIVNWTNLTESEISLSLFPNPAVEKIRLGIENAAIDGQLLRVVDMNGKQIYEGNFNDNELFIDIQKWPSSWYVIQLFSSDGVLLGSGQLVKQ